MIRKAQLERKLKNNSPELQTNKKNAEFLHEKSLQAIARQRELFENENLKLIVI